MTAPETCLPGSHEYTDTMDHEDQPAVLYCRKCADVQPLLLEVIEEVTVEVSDETAPDPEAIVTNVGPDQQDVAHELARDHARRVAGLPERRVKDDPDVPQWEERRGRPKEES